jgi:hypothetical protein
MRYINGADLTYDQLHQVRLAYTEASDPLWVERHNFPFDNGHGLMYNEDVVEDDEMVTLQEVENDRYFDMEARYEGVI